MQKNLSTYFRFLFDIGTCKEALIVSIDYFEDRIPLNRFGSVIYEESGLKWRKTKCQKFFKIKMSKITA